MSDESISVANAMEKYGGGFVKSLGVALFCADEVNAQKIKKTWPKYWAKYLEIAKDCDL